MLASINFIMSSNGTITWKNFQPITAICNTSTIWVTRVPRKSKQKKRCARGQTCPRRLLESRGLVERRGLQTCGQRGSHHHHRNNQSRTCKRSRIIKLGIVKAEYGWLVALSDRKPAKVSCLWFELFGEKQASFSSAHRMFLTAN